MIAKGKRGRILIAIVVSMFLFLGVAFFFASKLSSRIRINAETVKQIHNGMSEQEVERLLGGPAGDYSRHSPFGMVGNVFEGHIVGAPPPRIAAIKKWKSDDGEVWVAFTDKGEVYRTVSFFLHQKTLWEKLKDWMPW